MMLAPMGACFLTGASSGIGRSLARRLAREGRAMALVARRKDLLDTLVLEIEAEGGQALAIACDVTDRDAVRAAVARAEAGLGPIALLVANAGGAEAGTSSAAGFRSEVFSATYAQNVASVLYCVEAVLPGMLDRGEGHLVATSSLAGELGLPNAGAYSSAKAALTRLMESLRVELGATGVDVTILVPGFIRTKPGGKANRPFVLELEDATARIHRAIARRRPVFVFPWTLAWGIRLVRVLPVRLRDRLLRAAVS